jgi:hypothetical protein
MNFSEGRFPNTLLAIPDATYIEIKPSEAKRLYRPHRVSGRAE